MNSRRHLTLALIAIALVTVAVPVMANHQWGKYHWERSANPVNLTIGDNTSGWTTYLNTAISDWNQSSVLSLTKVSGQAGAGCTPDDGKIEVCNSNEGANGWLGIAGIWAFKNHITKAYSIMNDWYFDSGGYGSSAWRQLVMCQEVGHDFGLDHQDENFNNPPLGTCMDYTSDPTPNQHPNQHDYDQLEDIYAHLDGGGGGCKGKNCRASLPAAPPAQLEGVAGPGRWGQLVHRSNDGRVEVYELQYANGYKVVTHVLWVEGYQDLSDEEALLYD